MTDIVTHNDRIATIGMDLGKRSFHLIGMDARGKVITPSNCRGGDWSGTWLTSNHVSWGSKLCRCPPHWSSTFRLWS